LKRGLELDGREERKKGIKDNGREGRIP